ncbi:MAG: 16S rRNA (adenine(1518)-N(6)/adenine(1519)-N(6))-dimethyltransferase RsmA [Bacteroidota bacterium]
MVKVKPKKKLGQHFLTDANIALRIVEALQEVDGSTVIEVGPGTGVLSQYLLNKYSQFLAFDIDDESIAFLKQRYPHHQEKFRKEDFLSYQFPEGQVSIIGNFPYNISSQLLFKIWENHQCTSQVVCMLQKEVAQRICASPANKQYGILSVLLGAFFDIEYLFDVGPRAFDPPPKVDSAVIRLKRNETKALPFDQEFFKSVVKAGFGQRRKTLRNALKPLNLPLANLADHMLIKRAEQLSVEDFIALTRKLS